MSLQDESFPADELLDMLTFSPRPNGPHFQLPQQPLQSNLLHDSNAASAGLLTPGGTEANSSHCSSCISSDQSPSAEAHNERPPSGMSSKTSVSEKSDAVVENAPKRPKFAQNNHNPSKAGSFQDIHSEYTKRRFKHVASKVGEYIAHMKAEDLKHRRKIQLGRHRSMPDTLCGADLQHLTDERKREAQMHFSSDDLHRDAAAAVVVNGDADGHGEGDGGVAGLYESHSDDGHDGDIESAANTSVATSNANSNHNKGLSNSSSNSNNNNKNNHSDGSHETSNDTNTSDSIDKQIYAQVLHEKERIQSYSEYLQMKLDEKIAENMRLKRNVDYLRIELTTCQDKLKQKDLEKVLPMRGAADRLQLLHQTNNQHSKSSTATQTDHLKTPPSPVLLLHGMHEVYVTPDTPDPNNNKTLFDASTGNALKAVKTVATIQPLSLNFSSIDEHELIGREIEGNVILRQRTNSTVSMAKQRANSQKSNFNNNNNNGNARKKKKSNNTEGAYLINAKNSSVLPHAKSSARLSCSPGFQQPMRNAVANAPLTLSPFRNRDADLFYYDAQRRSTDVGTAVNASSSFIVYEDENDDSAASHRKTTTKKRNTLRRRWLRFFATCTRCSDPQYALNDSNATQTYTQIPLLEKSSENLCSNVR